MASHISARNESREIVPTRHNLFDETSHSGVRSIGKIISLEQFMSIPAQIGGRVAVIPWYMANVVSQNGTKRPQAMVRMCVSNNLYLSDFGGGFKKPFTPYAGLKKELNEEVPLWSNYLMDKLVGKGNLFIVLEQYNIDPKKKQPIPIKILIFIKTSVDILNELGFVPTDEVRALADYTLVEFNRRVDETPLIGNDGIRMYHQFRQREDIHRYLDAYFRSSKVSDTEFIENDLTNNKVNVVLSDGVTTLPFSQLVKNNSEFSRNMDVAYRKRLVYAKQKMAGRPSPAHQSVKARVSNKSNEKKENSNRFVTVSHHKSSKKHFNKNNTRKKRNNYNKKV